MSNTEPFSYLLDLLGIRFVKSSGTAVPQSRTMNFKSGVAAVYNATTGEIDIDSDAGAEIGISFDDDGNTYVLGETTQEAHDATDVKLLGLDGDIANLSAADIAHDGTGNTYVTGADVDAALEAADTALENINAAVEVIDTLNAPADPADDGKVAIASGGDLTYALVDTENIANQAIATGKIGNAQVTAGKMAQDSVDTIHIVDGAVETAKIDDDAVTNAKLASNSVDTSQLLDNAVTTDKIALNAVNSGKIANSSIVTDHIDDAQVTAAKLEDDAFQIAANDQTGNYTLVMNDFRGVSVDVDSSSDLEVTVPPNSSVAAPLGSVTYITRLGTGTVSLVEGAGVTIRVSPNKGLFVGARYETVELRKIGTDEWLATGNLIGV